MPRRWGVQAAALIVLVVVVFGWPILDDDDGGADFDPVLERPAIDLPIPTCKDWDGVLRLEWIETGEGFTSMGLGFNGPGGEFVTEDDEARFGATVDRLGLQNVDFAVASGQMLLHLREEYSQVEIDESVRRLTRVIDEADDCEVESR